MIGWYNVLWQFPWNGGSHFVAALNREVMAVHNINGLCWMCTTVAHAYPGIEVAIGGSDGIDVDNEIITEREG
eukprot:13261498-Ditylum_brightwellii.AAC.1